MCDEGSLLLPSAVAEKEAEYSAEIFDNMPGRKDNQEEWSDFQKEFSGQSTPFAKILGCTAESRRLYRTARGFVGLGPESTKKGGQV